jgi:hypothetical protein
VIKVVERIIIAPHPDDEIIGCYNMLKSRIIDKVVFVTHERLSEAEESSKQFGFKMIVKSLSELHEILQQNQIVFTPHPYDHHPLHKTVTSIIQKHKLSIGYEIKYYSTDMNIPQVSEVKDWEGKKRMLYNIYPSQSKYFDVNPYWYLFEGISSHPSTPYVSILIPVYAYHYYPTSSREFLKYRHPHIFTIKVIVGVENLNREIEFYDLREDVMKVLRDDYGTMSCEAIAEQIYYYVKSKYQNFEYVPVKVEVYEDSYQFGVYGDTI